MATHSHPDNRSRKRSLPKGAKESLRKRLALSLDDGSTSARLDPEKHSCHISNRKDVYEAIIKQVSEGIEEWGCIPYRRKEYAEKMFSSEVDDEDEIACSAAAYQLGGKSKAIRDRIAFMDNMAKQASSEVRTAYGAVRKGLFAPLTYRRMMALLQMWLLLKSDPTLHSGDHTCLPNPNFSDVWDLELLCVSIGFTEKEEREYRCSATYSWEGGVSVYMPFPLPYVPEEGPDGKPWPKAVEYNKKVGSARIRRAEDIVAAVESIGRSRFHTPGEFARDIFKKYPSWNLMKQIDAHRMDSVMWFIDFSTQGPCHEHTGKYRQYLESGIVELVELASDDHVQEHFAKTRGTE